MAATPLSRGTIIEDYLEWPSWHFASHQNGDAGLPKISTTFIFARHLDQLDHIRLNALSDELQRDSEVWKALVEPNQSFFSDIVRGGLGRTGRPLIFLCEGERELDERTVVMQRPIFTDYTAETRHIRLWRSESKRAEIRWAMRDAFALFESGHLLYLLSLVSLDEQLDKIDEYALIQLQKLLDSDCEATGLTKELRFKFASPDDSRHTLASLVQTRLRELAKSADEKQPNGVRDVLNAHIMKVEGFPHEGKN